MPKGERPEPSGEISKIDWRAEEIAFGGCNCAYGCPCQSESLPTHGNCRGFEVLRIDDTPWIGTTALDFGGVKTA